MFEELAQNNASQSPHSLVAQAVSELHLGRLPEAEAAFQQAAQLDSAAADTMANMIVLNTLQGKEAETEQLKAKLAQLHPEHRALADWREKKAEFEKATTKYTPKFAEV